jgi:hypothetical protein
MSVNGSMEVYDNVVLEAKTAWSYGGAVSLPFEIGSHLPGVALGDTFGTGRFDSVRQFILVSESRMLIGVS